MTKVINMTDIPNTEYITIKSDGIFVGGKRATHYRGVEIGYRKSIKKNFQTIQNQAKAGRQKGWRFEAPAKINQTWSGIEVVITGLTRNQLTGNRPWVRIPPAPPEKDCYLDKDSNPFFHSKKLRSPFL